MKICPLCKKKGKLLFKFDEGDITLCKQCKLTFSEPKNLADKLYDETYYKNCYETIKNKQQDASLRYINKIKEIAENPVSILDYGCGTAQLLKAAQNQGFIKIAGADVSDAGLTIAKSNLGENAQLINLRKESLPNRKFDVITFVDSITSVDNFINKFNDIVKNNLNQNGIVFMRTPNITMSYVQYVKLISPLLPEHLKKSMIFYPKRYLNVNIHSIRSILDTVQLKVEFLSTEKDYVQKSKIPLIKKYLISILKDRIPGLLGIHESIIVIARKM